MGYDDATREQHKLLSSAIDQFIPHNNKTSKVNGITILPLELEAVLKGLRPSLNCASKINCYNICFEVKSADCAKVYIVMEQLI